MILAVGYIPPEMDSHLRKYEETYGIKITYSIEKEPLGTAEPIRLAKDLIIKDNP